MMKKCPKYIKIKASQIRYNTTKNITVEETQTYHYPLDRDYWEIEIKQSRPNLSDLLVVSAQL